METGVWIKLKDKRYDSGFNIKRFESQEITEEIIEFVRKHPNAFKIYEPGFFFYTREEFLDKFCKNINKKKDVKEIKKKNNVIKQELNIDKDCSVFTEKLKRKDITKFLGDLLVKEKLTGPGKYWAKEVSIDPMSVKGKRVDYMQFVPKDQCSISSIEKGIFVCYEIKSCVEDVYSGNGLNFFGEKNYIVTTVDCYKQLKEDFSSGKFRKYMMENHQESSLYYGVMVAIPKHKSLNEELTNPTFLSTRTKEQWNLVVAVSCREGSRKHSMSELLFCMLRSGK